jgi:signal transduction histidine kinase
MTIGRSPQLWIRWLLGSWLLATLLSWTPISQRIDNDFYDWATRLWAHRHAPAQSIVVGIDEQDLNSGGGPRNIRILLRSALDRLCAAKPSVIAVDVVITDPGDPQQDQQLADSVQACAVPVVLSAAVHPTESRWELPLDSLQSAAKAIGHVQSVRDVSDGVLREYSLEWRAAQRRFWALAVETARLHRNEKLVESPDRLQLGSRTIPASLRDDIRPLMIDFDHQVAITSLHDLNAGESLVGRELPHGRNSQDKTQLQGRAVFLGVTSIGYSRDRVVTPHSAGSETPGVLIHALAFETLLQGRYFSRWNQVSSITLTLAIAALAGLIFWKLPTNWAYSAAAMLLAFVVALPHVAYLATTVAPFVAPVITTVFCLTIAATLQFFATRHRMEQAERDRERYQQAIHMVTHEMRTPLTAIQGSSELMGRYSLKPEKQKQLADMIHQESKRLAKMVQTFLDVERLGAGQLEIKRERMEAAAILQGCVDRVRVLADRKNIQIEIGASADVAIVGDQELLEYAAYNILTNAVKYSPAETTILVETKVNNGRVGLSVKDQGYGMTAEETKLIFTKFFRTKSAEKSNEVGTGIGLALVKEIIDRHGGTIEVESAPSVGSRFTLWIPEAVNEVAQAVKEI